MCPTCHKKTDNVDIYDVETLKGIKQEHESKALKTSNERRMEFELIDFTATDTMLLPANLALLELDHTDPTMPRMYQHAVDYLARFSRIPIQTREFFAMALLRAEYYDYTLSFQWQELRYHLCISATDMDSHIDILEHHKLLRRGESYGPDQKKCWFTFFDFYDDELFFLKAVHDTFGDQPDIIKDMFMDLNFNLMEGSLNRSQ